MTSDSRRITLVTRGPQSPERDWNGTPEAPNRIIFIKALTVLRYALGLGITEMEQDVERVILDQSTTPAEFLELLASLPREFTGDVLLIRTGDSGFLSALGRGGDRVLYALGARDIAFYLETHALVGSEVYAEVRLTA
jgi:hypothetical protein